MYSGGWTSRKLTEYFPIICEAMIITTIIKSLLLNIQSQEIQFILLGAQI